MCSGVVATVLGKRLLGGSWKVRGAVRRRQHLGVPRAGAGAGARAGSQLLASGAHSHSSRSVPARSRDLMRAQGLRLSLEKG